MAKQIKMFILFSCFFMGVLWLPYKLLNFNSCLVKQLIGIECPACGITHSVYSTLGLDFRQAIRYNLAGPVVTMLLFINWFYYLETVTINRIQLSLRQEKKLSDISDWILVGSLLFAWLFKMILHLF